MCSWTAAPLHNITAREHNCAHPRGPDAIEIKLLHVKGCGIGSSGMKGWRGISESPWELKVGRGIEIHGGNMLPCQPSNFSNRRKLVMNNCWVGTLREKTCSVQNQKVIFLIINLQHSPYEILPWQSVCRSFLLSCTRPCCAHLLIWEVSACSVVMGTSPEPMLQADPSPLWIISPAAVKARCGFHQSVSLSSCFGCCLKSLTSIFTFCLPYFFLT